MTQVASCERALTISKTPCDINYSSLVKHSRKCFDILKCGRCKICYTRVEKFSENISVLDENLRCYSCLRILFPRTSYRAPLYSFQFLLKSLITCGEKGPEATILFEF